MHDVYGKSASNFDFIISKASAISTVYGFTRVDTPILEFSNLFERNLGEESDVVSKEIYKFKDRGGEDLALRPEFTAGIVRCLIENNLKPNSRIFSYGPLFRYDRPQKGRYRQFHQINFEIFGKGDVFEDAEALSLAYNFLISINLGGKFTLEINSLGSKETLQNYTLALKDYFTNNIKNLSDLSIARLQKNPLRILDSKDEVDILACKDAPKISELYSSEESERFKKLQNLLTELNIQFKINESIVRGLDYYTGLVFEFTTEMLGTQSTILGGGRYDNLVGQMGGRQLNAIGFAAGIERLSLLCNPSEVMSSALFILPLNEENNIFSFKLLEKLRSNSIISFILIEGNIGKRIEKASKEPYNQFIIVIGEKEMESNIFEIKNLKTGERESGKIDFIIKKLLGIKSNL